jgi:Protein of unknown function (DUF3562)
MKTGGHGDGDIVRSERAILALANASHASPEEVRDLFTVEFNRLERVARIRTYLHVLATAKVRSMLSRAAPGHGRPAEPVEQNTATALTAPDPSPSS